jgi:AcrR family transcriptional regulator
VAAREQLGGRERILAAAMETLDRDGEAALRFTDIAERAEVVVSVVAHHFGSREGLVTALHAQRYAGLAAADQAALQQLAETAVDRSELAAGIAAITASVVDRARADVRLVRTVSIGATHGRDELRERIRDTATELLDALTTTVVMAQEHGLLHADVDPRALAIFIQAYALGMIVADLDRTPPCREAIAAVIQRALDGFLTEPA